MLRIKIDGEAVMSSRRKYGQDDDLQLRLLEVTEDPTYGKSKHQEPRDVILVDKTSAKGLDQIHGVRKTLH